MRIKNILFSLPLIGYLLRILLYIYRLPRIEDQNEIYRKQQIEAQESTANKIYDSQVILSKLHDVNNELSKQLRFLNNRVHSLSTKAPVDMQRSSNKKEKYFAENHLLDEFYLEFENQFRGNETDISSRLEEYLPLFSKYKKPSKNQPILDIGCGRGELLSLLGSNGFRAIGIDINSAMVKDCLAKGFEVVEGNAIDYLSSANPGTFSVITGFHIVEHIEFSELLNLFSQCYKAIDDKGFVLFETPNPENVYVGANTFYYDPSHLKPLPPGLLKFAMETVGFSDVSIKALHPEIENKAKDKIGGEIHRRLFGPRDYAVIARK